MPNTTGARAGSRLALGLLLVGCSTPAAQPASAPPSAASAGAETPAAMPEAPEATEAAPPAPAPSAPATLTVEAAVHGELKPASVKLMSEDGEQVASGATGQAISVQSGEYTLIVAIEDAAVLADRPTQRVPITIAPGADVKHHIDFPWASIQLRVRVNGEPESQATVRVMRQGAVVATVKSEGEHIMLSPGRYQAEVNTRGATIEVKQVLFPEGATQTVPVDVRM